MKEKRIIITLFILGIIFSLMGGTLAFINWQTTEAQQTAVTFTVTPNFSCSADAGGHITSNDRKLAPTDCMDPEYAIQRTITTSSTTTGDKVISMDLWLNVNHIDTNLLNSPNFKYAITKNKNSCTSGLINSGVINEDIQDNKINLLEGVEYATLNDKYYLYIWLDEAETNINTMNQSFDLSIDGQCNDNGLEKTTMVNFTSSNTSAYFKEADYKTKITEIHFVYDKDLPEGVMENQVSGKNPYQLSTNANKPIYGYLNKIGDTDTYKLYITSAYKIYAQSLSNVFDGMTALTNIVFDNFDTSNVTDMGAMFQGCSSLTSINVSSFNTSNVIYMSRMFNNCSNLTHLELGNFDTSNVTIFYYMFRQCSKLASVDLSSFDTSKVANMASMFYKCYAIESLDMTHFNTSNVTTMSDMFYGCSKLTLLDLSSWSTPLLQNTHWMFMGCGKLTTIYVSELWNMTGVTSHEKMFNNDTKLVGGNGTKYNSSNVDKTYARIDNPPDAPGYLTYKAYNG